MFHENFKTKVLLTLELSLAVLGKICHADG